MNTIQIIVLGLQLLVLVGLSWMYVRAAGTLASALTDALSLHKQALTAQRTSELHEASAKVLHKAVEKRLEESRALFEQAEEKAEILKKRNSDFERRLALAIREAETGAEEPGVIGLWSRKTVRSLREC